MLKIEFDKKDINRIVSALSAMQAALPNLRDEMTYRQAVDYRNMLFANIDTQKFAGGYKKYNTKYAAWKQNMGLGNKYWELYGDLISNIDIVKRSGIGHAVGVFTNKEVGGKSWNSKPGQRVGKKYSISAYAYGMEFGNLTRRIPKRPLFGPTLREFKMTGAMAPQQFVLEKLRSKWR